MIIPDRTGKLLHPSWNWLRICQILKFKNISQSSDQIIIDLSEWRDFESKRIKVYNQTSKTLQKKSGISYDSIKYHKYNWQNTCCKEKGRL